MFVTAMVSHLTKLAGLKTPGLHCSADFDPRPILPKDYVITDTHVKVPANVS